MNEASCLQLIPKHFRKRLHTHTHTHRQRRGEGRSRYCNTLLIFENFHTSEIISIQNIFQEKRNNITVGGGGAAKGAPNQPLGSSTPAGATHSLGVVSQDSCAVWEEVTKKVTLALLTWLEVAGSPPSLQFSTWDSLSCG